MEILHEAESINTPTRLTHLTCEFSTLSSWVESFCKVTFWWPGFQVLHWMEVKSFDGVTGEPGGLFKPYLETLATRTETENQVYLGTKWDSYSPHFKRQHDKRCVKKDEK